MGKSGLIVTEDKTNKVYHDVVTLFKIYRSVSWRMQVQVNQVKHRFQREYGTDIDEFLDSIYQAGMDLNEDDANIRYRVEAISSSNKFLKLIDEAVELMRQYHPQGEKYYWILYYTYMSARQPMNAAEIIRNLESHLPDNMQINRSTYFRWREGAFKAVEGILWGYEEESRRLLEHFRDTWNEKTE